MRGTGAAEGVRRGGVGRGIWLTAVWVQAAWVGAAALLGAGLLVGVGRGEAQGVAMPLLPASVAYDAAGNLYFADTDRQVVYESSLGGVLTVVAGDGVQGYAGDGGPATAAELNSPEGVAVGADGTLYIADTGNARVRAVNGGVIRTFAGTGEMGFGGDGGAATAAMFRVPGAVAVDASGALLVCDAGDERVRRISGGVIETVVGDGVQGFGGDGGAATAAELDTPMGVAVGPDGRMFVADSHNQRIRVVGTDGVIGTFAGSGVRGFAGDGGAAVAAELSQPMGVAVTGGGAVIFADSDNQRIRMVTAGGVISTVAGTGVQGAAADGTAAMAAEMNAPRGVAVSGFGAPVYADALNRLVRESLAVGVYVPGGMAAARSSAVTLSVSQDAGGVVRASVQVAGSVGVAMGVVELLDGAKVVTQATLNGGVAIFAAQTMGAGTHALSASYLGDGVNLGAVSAVSSVDVPGTVLTVTATANAASMAYGAPMPMLTGSLSGVQAADVGKVAAVFTAAAGAGATVGSYAIGAVLTGPAAAKYHVVMSASSGRLQVVQAASVTVEQALTQGSYAGLPLLLSAQVSAAGAGQPTGTVQFVAGGTVVASGPVVGGVASGIYLAPPAGALSVRAEYGGDTNFEASSSEAVTAVVGVVPDFTLAGTGSLTQTIGAGQVANFTMVVGAQSGAFTGAVGLSASGLPAGATVSFSPPQVVPGTGSATVTMSVQTSEALTTLAMLRRYGGVVSLGVLLPWLLAGRKRRGGLRAVAACGGLLGLLLGMAGCGARSVSSSALGAQTYALTVKGTATNLAGAVVSHSVQMTLVVK